MSAHMRKVSGIIGRQLVLAATLGAIGCAHPAYRNSRFEGPQHFTMPDLRGVSAVKAEQLLRRAGKLGLVDWREEDCGRQAAVGVVCYSYPWPGAAVMKAEPIALYVQSPRPRSGVPAPTRAPMPDVVGQPLTTARQTLASAGFTRVVVHYLEHDGCAAETVCGIGPRPGATGHHALQKILYVGKDKAPIATAAPPAPLKAPVAPRPPKSFF
jgi:beta-lactam-binding protein with PASTA domain